MSWKSAQAEADRFVARLNLKNDDIRGRLLDLDELFAKHPSEGRFRLMILQAAERILKNRGANVTYVNPDQEKLREQFKKEAE